MIRDNDRTLYPFIIIWYVMKHCAEALPPEFFSLLHINLERLRSQYSGPTDVGKGEYPTKLIFLMWYSYACLGEIYQHLPEEIQHNNPAPQSVKREIRNIAKAWQKKAESTMASVRKNTTETYSEQEEMIDRLVILGPELGLPSTCVAHTRRRISERRQTTALNPGYVRFHKGVARAPITPPWELSCLNHHARLALWNEPEMDEQELKTARSDSLQFMTATYTFLPNWDIGFPNVASLWWDIDAAAIMCSTFLDMRTKPASVDKVSAEDDAPKPEFSQKLQPTTALTETEMMNEKEMKSVVESKPKKDSPDDTIADLLRRQLQKQDIIINCLKKENDMVLEYDWINFSPPYILHPDTWIQSLDDTPELYRSAQTKTVQLRNGILQYFDRKVKSEAGTTLEKDLLAPPEWTVGKIAEQFDLDELLHLTVIDIGFHWNGRTEVTITGRLQHQELIDEDGKNNEPQIFTFDGGNHEPNAFGPSPESLTLRLWTTYLDGYLAEDQPVLKGDALQRKYAGLSSKFKELLKSPKTLKEVKEKQRNALLHVLNDSLLDRAVRYRIFFLQKCSPSVVKAFIYMWHVQAIDTFDNHFRDSSHFFDARKEVWVTSISLSYWGFKQDTKHHGLFHEQRDKAPFPPKKVLLQKKVKQRWWRQEHNEVEPTNEIEEGSSSLVISGDVSGNWWTCSIISPVLSETTMMDRIDPIMINLQCFVHQPSTGRCLIFLAFLGIICESLSKEYDAILDEMNRAIKLGRQVLKRGLDWEHEEEAIQRLKSMLWALEALRIFDDRLSDSLDKVREAKESMRKYIIQGPGRRHQELEHQCQIRLEDFDKQYGNLVSVHVKIEQKIVQISRFREGISAVSSLEDTHTALKQNDTIRILTYITIAYLPVSFVAALWSVDLVSENLGGGVFGGLLATFLIATFALAKSLASIMNAWEKSVQKIAKIIDRTKASEDWDVDCSSEDEDLSRKSKFKAAPGSSPTWPMVHRRRRKAMQAQRKGSVSTSEKVNGMLLGD
ncbi:hypothetical protein B0O99DRAFT_76478 [Bisporella sp. PMI_857]|nr:hypothetical protein B0O99DRAFT_76478 [Bisporella sp. PMI_857]